MRANIVSIPYEAWNYRLTNRIQVLIQSRKEQDSEQTPNAMVQFQALEKHNAHANGPH